MKRQRSKAAGWTALAVLLLASASFAGWWDGVADAQPVDLAEVVKDPHAYKGKEVSFTCTFHKVSTFYNPYYTRFLPSQYVNFSVWPSSARLWNEGDYMASHPFCFLERDHKSFQQLMGLKRFTSLRLTGYVQNTFKSMPWIEVRHVEVLDESITKDTLREIILGDRAAEGGDWSGALSHYSTAGRADLPEEVAANVAKKRCRALVQMGRHHEAAPLLEGVLATAPRDPEALELLTEVNDALGMNIQPPVLVENEEPAEALPVEPERYPGPVEAMPAPGTSWEEYTPSVEHTPVHQPVDGEKPPAVKSPEMAPEPEAVPVPEVVPAPVPEEETEQKRPEPEREPAPKKRMSGPM